MKRLRQYLYMAVVIASCIPLQAFHLTVLPFVWFFPRPYHWVNTRVAGSLWSFWVWLVVGWHKTKITISGDVLKPGENAIILANHQSWCDVVMVCRVSQEVQMICHQKWMAKDSLRYVPFIGWGLSLIDTVFLKRNWTKDQKKIESTFSRILSRDIPFWLIVFPEGTRKSPLKIQASQNFMAERGEPRWQHVMRPRSKGLAAALLVLKPRLDAIYSLTIHYGDFIPTPFELFAGEVPQIRIHVQRYGRDVMESMSSEEEVKDFLWNDFSQKDKWMESVINKNSSEIH